MSTPERAAINKHLFRFHNRDRTDGTTLTKFVYHEMLHANGVDGIAGKPLHAHISETDLDAIKIYEELPSVD